MHIYDNISPNFIGLRRVSDESFMPNAFLFWKPCRLSDSYKKYDRKREGKEVFTQFT